LRLRLAAVPAFRIGPMRCPHAAIALMGPELANRKVGLSVFLLGWPLIWILVWAIGPGPAEAFTLRAGSLSELAGKLRACWVPPHQNARTGMEITLRLSFKANGAVLGRPRVTFESPGRQKRSASVIGFRSQRCCNDVRRLRLLPSWALAIRFEDHRSPMSPRKGTQI
jgi:hypothetical protein